VQVLSPENIDFEIYATIVLQDGADAVVTLTNVNTVLNVYKENLKKALKAGVKRAEIIAIIFNVPGIENLELTSPADDTILICGEFGFYDYITCI